jgi:hypothetical protein
MKIQLLGALAIAGALLVGCTSERQKMGASAENDQNVLTGGPIVGTRISDLPQPVRDTLRQSMPNAEIADIEKSSQNGEIVYKVSFLQPNTHPTVWIRQDGSLVNTGSQMPNQGQQ